MQGQELPPHLSPLICKTMASRERLWAVLSLAQALVWPRSTELGAHVFPGGLSAARPLWLLRLLSSWWLQQPPPRLVDVRGEVSVGLTASGGAMESTSLRLAVAGPALWLACRLGYLGPV